MNQADPLRFDNPQQPISAPVATDVGPSLTGNVNNGLLAAWKGSGGDERIWYSTYDLTSWAPQKVMPNPVRTSVGPSLVTLGFNTFLAAWKGGDSDERIWYSIFNGAWSPQQVIQGGSTSVKPSLCPFEGKIFGAWKGGDGDERIWYSTYDWSSWSPKIAMPDPIRSSVGPSLAIFIEPRSTVYLYAMWKGGNGDERIWYSRFDGKSWAPQKALPDPIRSSTGPCVAYFQSSLYVAWKGGDGDEKIWYTMSVDGINFGFDDGTIQKPLPTNVATSGVPSLASATIWLYFAWKGIGSDNRIWWIAGTNAKFL